VKRSGIEASPRGGALKVSISLAFFHLHYLMGEKFMLSEAQRNRSEPKRRSVKGQHYAGLFSFTLFNGREVYAE